MKKKEVTTFYLLTEAECNKISAPKSDIKKDTFLSVIKTKQQNSDSKKKSTYNTAGDFFCPDCCSSCWYLSWLTTYSYQRAYYYELDDRFLNELGLLGHAGISLPCRQFLSLQQRGGHVGLTGCRTGTYPARTVWKHRQCARFYVQLWRRTDGQAGMDREISACKERES